MRASSYVYHALHSYFDRDNVALPNVAKYFNEQVASCLMLPLTAAVVLPFCSQERFAHQVWLQVFWQWDVTRTVALHVCSASTI